MEDANKLIALAREIGLIDSQFKKEVPFAQKCMTQGAVRQSHYDKDTSGEAWSMENIYGMLLLLAMGLGGSVTAAIGEAIYYLCCGGKR